MSIAIKTFFFFKDLTDLSTAFAKCPVFFSLLKREVEVKMLKQLMKKFSLIKCTVTEPSVERITSYKKLVEDQKESLKGVTFDWRQETIQEFCKANADGSEQFHFVSFIHSIYFIDKQDLDFCLNILFEWTKGKILIMLGAGNSKYFLCMVSKDRSHLVKRGKFSRFTQTFLPAVTVLKSSSL